MKSSISAEIIKRLIRDYKFKEENGYLRYGVCPECGKKELFTSIESPYIVHCGRENNCGVSLITKELYADLFASWSDRYISTKEEPYAAADAYLREARNIDAGKLKGSFTQERYTSKEGEQTATVRFTLVDGVWWERIIDRPERFDRKANFGGSYKGLWWVYPGLDLSKVKELWITEGIFDAISLNQNGIAAVSVMSCVNYPGKALQDLAAACGKKTRPGIVWALDNGRGGESYAKKHAERAAKDGWKTGAALPMPEGGGCDWNDLHIAGKLKERDIKRYRYNGALLLAKSATSRALIMHQHTGRTEFHFYHDNRTYWFKLDFDRYSKAMSRIESDPARKNTSEEDLKRDAIRESGAIKDIANCRPVPLYFMRSDMTDDSYYYFEIRSPDDTPPVKGEFTAAQISSASEFKKRLLHVHKGGMFTGNTMQLDAILKNTLPGIKEVKTQNFIGYNKEWGAWVFNKLAVCGGKFYELNKEDYFEVNGMNIKTLSHSPEINISTDDSLYNPAWAHDVWAAFGVNGYVVLAFWMGALFAEQIRQKHKSFPFLEIVGEPGTGKTTLIDLMWRLCGRENYEGFDPSKATLAARARNFSQVSNLPVVLIEGDRIQDTQKQRGFDFDELKPLYNGVGLRATGLKTSNNDTNEPPFKGAIVIAQNATVTASEAVTQRIIHVMTDKSGQNAATREAATRIEQMPVNQVSGFLLKVTCREADIMGAFDDLCENARRGLEDRPDVNNVRIAKNHAQMIALVSLLPLVIDVPVERIAQTCDRLAEMAAERVRLLKDDVPMVAEFWEKFDYLDSVERYGANHYGQNNNRGLIAVSFPHLEGIAARHNVRLNITRELLDALRAGRVRKCTSDKAIPVRSEISKAENSGRGDAQQKEPDVVKCWIFQAEQKKSGE
ncbi:toprim domain-containing protein [Salmonella enterica]|nr:bifunctional DNA primase/helicase [Salmonella enterica]EEF4031241.1 bifunctional DNA primase/helicase [Salmonella enterica]EEJ5982598.1 toprim domain-containing protein [Salmonella enterica]EEL9688189.1 bifunctional DNA primase/helicase [Salmonella enterica]EEU3908187.1 toprim domain-containing protein [Salmonella enterica]